MTTNHTPVVTYTITEGQLVRLCDGVQEDAIDCSVAFAATDLLAALEAVCDRNWTFMGSEEMAVIINARAVCARAKGEA